KRRLAGAERDVGDRDGEGDQGGGAKDGGPRIAHDDLLQVVPSCLARGRRRMRLPVAAKMALAMAGAATDVPGSPMPPGAFALGTSTTSMAGASSMRRTR